MAFELWETKSRNLAGVYDTEEAALAVVREFVEARGRSGAANYALVHQGSGGRLETIATADALLDLALGSSPRPTGAAS